MGLFASPFFSNRFNNSEYPITFNILHIAFISILEHIQNYSGQKYLISLVDISFFTVLLTIFHNFSFYPIVSFSAFVYEIIETLSWLYISSGINFQVLSALEFIYALNAMPENVMRIFFWSIVIFGFTNVDIFRLNFRFTSYEFYLFVMLLMILFFPFSFNKYTNLYPFRINGLMSKKVFDKIIISFTSKKQTNFESSVHKNLIMIEIESFETKCLGRFNKNYPKSMPFLSNLSDNILHFSKIQSQPYTTWSAAGMFVVHCGFPLIVNNVDWSVRENENFESWKKLSCISDFLYSLGYNQKAFCTGSCDIMSMKNFIIDHHYQTFDMAEHGIDRDSVLFNHIENDILPDLVKASKEEKKPFSLFILTADTHPEFWVDDKFCPDLTDENFKSNNNAQLFDDDDENRFNNDFFDDRSREPMPKLFRCFTCFDRIFKKFYHKIGQMGLNASNTVLVVYGDHLTMGERSYYYGTDRTLSLIFPLITKNYLEKQYRTTKKALEKKKITYYDVAPTILDLLNIKYSPPFPFGNSAFSVEQNDPPTVDDFKFIYNYLTGDIKYENVRCLASQGFCTGNEY